MASGATDRDSRSLKPGMPVTTSGSGSMRPALFMVNSQGRCSLVFSRPVSSLATMNRSRAGSQASAEGSKRVRAARVCGRSRARAVVASAGVARVVAGAGVMGWGL